MAIAGVAAFFTEVVAGTILDKVIDRVTGEEKEVQQLRVNVKVIKENVESIDRNLQDLDSKLDTVLEVLRQQVFEDYQLGLRSLLDARVVGESERNYTVYLNSAVLAFSRGASRNNASGLMKAKLLVDKAICHRLLQEKPNAILALQEARQEARIDAQQKGEVYERKETSQAINIQLPNGQVVSGVQWIRVDTPTVRDGALELIDEIDQALYVVRG